MAQRYAIVQNGTGWVLRQGRTPLVEFPTRTQALRAGAAVCRDEGLRRLLIVGRDGARREVDPFGDLEALDC